MRSLFRLVVLAALAAAPSRAAFMDAAPMTSLPSAPAAIVAPAAAVAPLNLGGISLGALSLPAAAAAPAPALSVSFSAAAPATALPALQPAPFIVRAAALAGPMPKADGNVYHLKLIQSAAAPLPDFQRMGDGDIAAAAEKDFNSRAQLEAPLEEPAAIPGARTDDLKQGAWSRLKARVLGRPIGAERAMAETIIPAWMSQELPVASAKLGQNLSEEKKAAVLERSKVWVYSWHSGMTYEIGGGLPDGHFDARFGIRVMLKTNWRRLKDPETHFKVLYAHEYTHWLQDEGLVTRRYGVEPPSVAVELLRAMELVGWEGMKAGKVSFIAAGTLGAFENGREWARGDMSDATALMFRGVLGGAAYEVGVMAGRPEAAWEFLNLVIAEKGGLSPREARERVLSGATRVAAR